MNRIKALDELKACQLYDDTEEAHEQADRILCNLLLSLGYEDVVSEYNKVDKWYS